MTSGDCHRQSTSDDRGRRVGRSAPPVRGRRARARRARAIADFLGSAFARGHDGARRTRARASRAAIRAVATAGETDLTPKPGFRAPARSHRPAGSNPRCCPEAWRPLPCTAGITPASERRTASSTPGSPATDTSRPANRGSPIWTNRAFPNPERRSTCHAPRRQTVSDLTAHERHDKEEEIVTKALVVFESMFGNTEQIAQAVAEGLRASMPVDVTEVINAPADPPEDITLIVAGGPTEAFSMSRTNDPRRRGQPRWSARPGGIRPAGVAGGAACRVIRTPNSPRLTPRSTRCAIFPGRPPKSAAKAGRRHGFDLAAPPESFFVRDTAGPLVEGELDRARAWGQRLGDLMSTPARSADQTPVAAAHAHRSPRTRAFRLWGCECAEGAALVSEVVDHGKVPDSQVVLRKSDRISGRSGRAGRGRVPSPSGMTSS